MPSNTQYGSALSGQDLELARQPLNAENRGGLDLGALHAPPSGSPSPDGQDFQGKGPFLEQDDQTVFRQIHQLVLRQERLARNRLAKDSFWTRVKQGYGLLSRLVYRPKTDTYVCQDAPMADTLTMAPVPNKAADLCNKVVETILVDLPKPAPDAENDSEDAERAAEMAEEWLLQDGGEKGTRDAQLFWQACDQATTQSSSFLHLWVDPTGNGWVPLQIKAHPNAQDPENPLVDPMGTPTTDPILRYVSQDEQGKPTAFVTDPSQAGQQWLPKIRCDLWGREHVRCFPETADVADAEMVIGLSHCTVGDAKRRWPDTLGQMQDAEIGALCDWVPPRYSVLLPPALRARWKLATGETTDAPGSANDERTLFFYLVYRRSTPLYPDGCHVVVNGANGGTRLHAATLSAPIPMPTGGTEPRCLDIPIVQVSLVLDPHGRDPMGDALIARFGGGSEALSQLGQGFLEAIDFLLHPASFIASTSPVTADDISQSRLTGAPINVLYTQGDKPTWEDARPIPAAFQGAVEWLTESMDSAASMNAPVQGSDKQQEVSGKARQIAVNQAMVALGRMQQAVASAHERFYRVKVQLAMQHFTTPQLIRYVGEDGAYKQEWWTGVDFARVTDVGIQPGTGTMMPPQEKVNYTSSLVTMGFMDPDTAKDAARPAFTQALGLPDDPHQQRVERQVSAWLKGPPQTVPGPADPVTQQPTQVPWVQAWQGYQQQVQQYQQVQAQAQQAAVQHQQASASASVNAHPSAPPAPPPMLPPPQAPWHPFANSLPCDKEPPHALLRMRRLSNLMATARFEAQPPEWQQVVMQEHAAMMQVVAMAQPAPALPRGVTIGMKGDASTVGSEEQAAAHPQQSPPPSPPTQQAA